MIIVADTNILLDVLDDQIADPYSLIRPYRVILFSPVTLHEALRAYPEELHASLIRELQQEVLPAPLLEHWLESARILRKLYSHRQEKNIARMQNDVLIALAAREAKAPVWSRDTDFKGICDHIEVGLVMA